MEPVARVGNALTGIGAGGTIVFGIWLAFSLRRLRRLGRLDHRGIVLWAVGGGAASGRARRTCRA